MNNIILGPPGAGKTQTLLTLMEQALNDGVHPRQIGFLAFTRKAANEAKDRAASKFSLSDRDLPYFRTIHSLAFRQLGLSKLQVMQRENYKELGARLGIEITGYVDMYEGSETAYGMRMGDRLIFMSGLARAKMITLRQQWQAGVNEDIDWWELDRVSKGLQKYKQATGLLDFTDMLYMLYESGHMPKLKVLFIDEAQDLSLLQWKTLSRLISSTEQVYIAGDDDQSIFAWSGADTNYFINLQGNVKVLDQSYRVPRKMQELAQVIASRITNRRPKVWQPKAVDGDVQWHNGLNTVPLEEGEWLLLARNGYMLKDYEDYCMMAGFSFEGKRSPLRSPALTAIRYWERLRQGEALSIEQVKKAIGYLAPQHKPATGYEHLDKIDLKTLIHKYRLGTSDIWHKSLSRISAYEREYFIAARRRNETLTKTPRIRISTIHGAKGGEADNVLLMTDIAPRTYNEMNMDMDPEHRVFYVGVTRAKRTLHLLSPHTNMSFPI